MSNNRTITLNGPKIPVSSMGTRLIMFSELEGTDGVNELFDYRVMVYSRDEYGQGVLDRYISEAVAKAGGSVGSNWDVEALIGSAVTISIEQDGRIDVAGISTFGIDLERSAGGVLQAAKGRGTRHINALVTEARYVGVKGRHAQYELRLRPWLHLLTLNLEYRVFQQQSAPEIIQSILGQYLFPIETRIVNSYPQLDMQIQYGSSDFDYISLLMQEWGLNYWFEHKDGKHTLIISDNLSGFKPMSSVAYQDLYTYPPKLKLQEEYLDLFNDGQTHITGQYQGLDYQFKQNTVTQTTTQNNPYNTAFNQLEVAEWNQGHFVDTEQDGDFKATIYMEAMRQHGRRATAGGNVRGIEVGHTFKLHNASKENSNIGWIVLRTHYVISETLEETSPDQMFSVRADFMVQPDTEQVRPDRLLQKPVAQTQTATVVGPEGKEVWVDQYARIKVKFHWDRYGTSDENASCWVRVSSPWAGMNYGGIQHPRIGQEVIIDFMNHDADMPYVSGRLTNPTNMPLWALPSQNALSGFKSKEIDGARNNHLIMDDTTGEIQTQLTSDHGLSQLNLGYVTRIPSPSGRADYRGQGFELRTDYWGVLRSGAGMFLTTQVRAGGASHQTDVTEAHSQLKASAAQHKAYSEVAQDHKALALNAHTALESQNEQIIGEKAGAGSAVASVGQAATDAAALVQGKLALKGAFTQAINGAMGGVAGQAVSSLAESSHQTTAVALNGPLGEMLSRVLGKSLNKSTESAMGDAFGAAFKDANLAGLSPDAASSIADQAVASQLGSSVNSLNGAAASAAQAALTEGLNMVDGNAQLLAQHVDNPGVLAAMQRASDEAFKVKLPKDTQDTLKTSLKAAAEQSLKGALKKLPDADALPPAEHGLNSQGQGKTREFTAPHLLIHGVAGIQATTPQSVHIASGQHTALTSGQDLSVSVGKRLAASVAKGISFFTQSLGIKLFAAKGAVEIQAQSDNIELIAEKVIKIISAKKSIEIAAKDEVLITAGGSYIRINKAGIEEGTPGQWKAWAADHDLVGPKKLDWSIAHNPPYDEMFVLKDQHGDPIADFAYKVTLGDGKVYRGVTNEKGEAMRIGTGSKAMGMKFEPDIDDVQTPSA
jgi:type VI secretion system secreted protein VgrG